MTFEPQLLQALRNAKRVMVLTGAGISAESGVPTFREAQIGLWSKFKPEDLATPEAFRQHPQRVWEWYAMRREKIRGVHPNPGHDALVAMEKRVPEFTLVTQNVDGLHQCAGSRRVIELHGNINRTKCFDEEVIVEQWPETGELPPRCPQCGGMLRPDVVWFGEMLPRGAFEAAEQASATCDVLLSVGTSSLVYPAAGLPYHALSAGAAVVEINPDRTPLTDHASHVLRGPSGKVLPLLVRTAWA